MFPLLRFRPAPQNLKLPPHPVTGAAVDSIEPLDLEERWGGVANGIRTRDLRNHNPAL